MERKTSRRKFLLTTASVAGGIVACSAVKSQQPEVSTLTTKAEITGTMPERILGKTGIKLPIFGLGGAGQTPLSKTGQEAASIPIIERALQLGIKYFDTAAEYGPSEENLGKILPQYRKQIFLASKTHARDRDGAWRHLENSLKRLKTDYLDLWQLHHVSLAEEITEIFSKNGAIKALEEAKQQKLIRFTGITGHHEPDIIAEALRRYDFDTTLICVNAADKHHPRPFIPAVMPIARQKNIGVIAMKVPAYGRLFKNGILDGMEQAMGYSLSVAGVHTCVIAAETPEQLESNVRVAQAYKPLSEKEMAAIEQRTATAWQDNTFFRAWT
ncbi:aldo/keto reductase [Ancylothrix sp. C2]|uniref:aldo/keto reductase n=1 Tax=Ancylothrix sp. D3o TaxID=2953691 RepID=UPI0021BA96A1|nr:aldo/keto reductase [Ancylothrix sp. D3o]MCT7948606.1 aldo/keto reductase [Ancylothrix sp. D3o]